MWVLAMLLCGSVVICVVVLGYVIAVAYVGVCIVVDVRLFTICYFSSCTVLLVVYVVFFRCLCYHRYVSC